MPYVFSTLTANTEYTVYANKVDEKASAGSIATPIKSVLVKGGANVNTRLIGAQPGHRTEISDEDALFLMDHPLFKTHQENGFVKIEDSKLKVEKAVKDMQARDASAPLDTTKGDFEAGGRAAGVAPTENFIQ